MSKDKIAIYHVAQPADLAAAQETGLYSSASLSVEGFIHCCLKQQLAGVVERYYADTAGLELLTIDPAKLDADLVYENTVGGEELFPHVYGQINLGAVTRVTLLKGYLLSSRP